MFDLTKKPFSKCPYRLAKLILVGAILITPFLVPKVAQLQSTGKEPIAYIGHGAMFDQNGNELAPSITFIREAQEWYRAELVNKLTKDQRAQFNRFERNLAKGLALDDQSQLVLNARLLDWLLDAAKPENGDRIRGKNNVMKLSLKNKLPESSDNIFTRSTEPFNANPQLLKRLSNTDKPKGFITQTLTGNGGAAYRAECLANGVPIPPDMGNAAWISRGQIPQPQLFIVNSLKAEVLTYQSTSPPGMCIALPRFNTGDTVQLDGVICLGQSGKACFWDNEKNGVTFNFQRGTARPFNDFGGGTELLGSVGGVCSDCHSGENPYIIHDAVLNSLSGLGLPTFAPTWHDPIVRSGDTMAWPENPGPMNAPPSCVGCHVQGSAGRFPHISTASPGYCGSVLAKSIQNTMPPGAPGTLAGTPEMIALQNWCTLAASGDASGRGDPHLTTFDGINYDFQGAGEFVYLRDADGLEIQTRQTPVSTASVVGPNAHTGLTSCVSVNTAVAARVGKFRVSYQPGRNAPELRIDGKLTEIGPNGINLGSGSIVRSSVGSGIEIFFPDKTHLIVTPDWWASQGIWYMNVDVVNTPGREGVIGAIAPGSWLPALSDTTSLGPIPPSLHQRYVDLNQTFANSWRVTNTTSLFDYAPGTSTATFTNPAWPPENPPCVIPASPIPPAKPMDPQRAQELCREITDENMNAQCVFDLTVTGEPKFAETYRTTQILRQAAGTGAGETAVKENKPPKQ